jgi:hypothetical protein
MAKNKSAAKKYLWEAKPPLTRSDLFQDAWEVGSFYADNDEKAIERMETVVSRHDVGQPLTIRLSCDGRMVRTFKEK